MHTDSLYRCAEVVKFVDELLLELIPSRKEEFVLEQVSQPADFVLECGLAGIRIRLCDVEQAELGEGRDDEVMHGHVAVIQGDQEAFGDDAAIAGVGVLLHDTVGDQCGKIGVDVFCNGPAG